MSKKIKQHTFEEYEVEGEEIGDIDVLDEIQSTDPDSILIYRKDETLGRFGPMAGLKGINPGDLSWDFLLDRLPAGEYELVAYKRGKGRGSSIVKRKKILLTSPFDKDEKNIPAFTQQPRTDSINLQAYLDNFTKMFVTILDRKEPAVNEKFDGMIEGVSRALDVYTKLLPRPESPETIIKQVESMVNIQEKLRPRTNWFEEFIPLLQIIGERLMSQFQSRMPSSLPAKPPVATQAEPLIANRPLDQTGFDMIFDSLLEKYLLRARRNEDPRFSADSFIADLEDLVQIGSLSIEKLKDKLATIMDVNFLDILKNRFPNIDFDAIFAWMSEFRGGIKDYVDFREPGPGESKPQGAKN